MFSGGSPLLSVIVRVLSARYRFIVDPGEERIVYDAPPSIADLNAKIGIARTYCVALRVEPSNFVEQGPTTREKCAGNGTYLMDHSSIVYLLDRNGRFVTHFSHESKAEAIAAAVKRQL